MLLSDSNRWVADLRLASEKLCSSLTHKKGNIRIRPQFSALTQQTKGCWMKGLNQTPSWLERLCKTLRLSESLMWTKWVQERRAGSYSCVRFPSRLAVGRCKANSSDSIRKKHEQQFSSSAHSLKMCWHQFSWFVKTGQSCFSDEWPTGGFWCNSCLSCSQDAGKVTQPWL